MTMNMGITDYDGEGINAGTLEVHKLSIFLTI